MALNVNGPLSIELLQHPTHGFDASVEQIRDVEAAHAQFQVRSVVATAREPVGQVEQEVRDALARRASCELTLGSSGATEQPHDLRRELCGL